MAPVAETPQTTAPKCYREVYPYGGWTNLNKRCPNAPKWKFTRDGKTVYACGVHKPSENRYPYPKDGAPIDPTGCPRCAGPTKAGPEGRLCKKVKNCCWDEAQEKKNEVAQAQDKIDREARLASQPFLMAEVDTATREVEYAARNLRGAALRYPDTVDGDTEFRVALATLRLKFEALNGVKGMVQ